MRWIKLGLWVLLTLSTMGALVTIVGQNPEPMTVTLFSNDIEPQPKWRILLMCVFLGALFSAVFFTVSLVILETKNIRLARSNRKLIKALERAGLGGSGSQDPSADKQTVSSASSPTAADDLEDESDV